MAVEHTASATWEGDLMSGSGTVSLGSGAVSGVPLSWRARAEDASAGASPEELIAAAHASCFTMALSAQLTTAGHEPTELHTTATVHMEKQDIGWTITAIQLDTHGSVPGVSPEQFQKLADDAKKGCPISRALASVPSITLTAKLD